MMRWLFRFSVYFVKPVILWWIVGYFSWQTVKAVAGAVSGYERAKVTAEIKAREKLQEFELKQAAKGNAPKGADGK